MIRAIPDADGWVNTIITQEVEGEIPAPPPGEVVLDAVPEVQLPLLYLRDGVLSTPHDDRVAWRRLRRAGKSGPESAALARGLRELGGLPDCGAVEAPTPASAGITVDYEDVPGLRLRPLSADDLDLAAPSAIEAGLQLARCPNETPCCRPPEAHAWFRLASRIDRDDTWQLVLEHEGRPLQMELILVNGDRAMFSYTMHFTRERPHWFWREAERPIFEKLKAAGVTRIHSRTRKDRPDWIQVLKDNYGAVDDGAWDDKTVRLKFDPETALNRMQGFPARRRVDGIPLLREGSEADLIAVEALLEELPAAQREPMRRTMREWWHLDRASLLLLHDDTGALRAARMIRHRRGTVAGFLLPTAMKTTPGYETKFTDAVKAWARGAGYSTLTGFTPSRLMEHPRVKALYQAAGGVRIVKEHSRFREPMTEIAIDL